MNGIALRADDTRALILPDEGGVAAELTVGGFDVLARTPWAPSVQPAPVPADDEATWVGRWRGGWQLCFPTAGAPDPRARPIQGFHGVASQSTWSVERVDDTSVGLRWADSTGLTAARHWTVDPGSLSVVTTARNNGREPRPIIVAEHLILGQDVLTQMNEGDWALTVEASGTLAELDYDGTPTGRLITWPGDDWDRVGRCTPPRVAALRHPSPRVITVTGPRLRAIVSWEGLTHALLWEEIGASTGLPWNGSVFALGIEPTSTPHGAGTAHTIGAITLDPEESMTWTTRLEVHPVEITPPTERELR